MKYGTLMFCCFAAASLCWGQTNPPNIPPLTNEAEQAERTLATQTAARLFSPSATQDEDSKPLRLVEVLGSIPDRQGQLTAVLDYWELSGKSALLAQAQRNQRFLEQLAGQVAQGRPNALQATALSAALSSAKANRTQQLIEVRQASQAFRNDSSAIVPIDLPHAAGYETRFDKLFPQGNAPAYATLLNRALPIRLDALNARAEAVQAAQDYLNTVQADFTQGRADLIVVLDSHRELTRQEEAFIKTVWQYNRDIARYAMPLARTTSSPNRLASMLIKVPRIASQAGSEARTVRKQIFPDAEQPVANPAGWQSQTKIKQAPRSSAVIRDPHVQRVSFQPVENSLLGKWMRLSERSAQEQRDVLSKQFLATATMESLRSCRLEECLSAVPRNQRATVVNQFWSTATELALFRWQQDVVEHLDQLQTKLLPILNTPADARQMLYLQVHRLEAAANTHNQALRMWYACYRLTRTLGISTDQPWRVAEVGEPFASPVDEPSEASQLWQQSAAALIASDSQVQAHHALFAQGKVDLPRLLSSLQWQTARSRAFLDAFVDAQVDALGR